MQPASTAGVESVLLRAMPALACAGLVPAAACALAGEGMVPILALAFALAWILGLVPLAVGCLVVRR